jgi:hypothetical protein
MILRKRPSLSCAASSAKKANTQATMNATARVEALRNVIMVMVVWNDKSIRISFERHKEGKKTENRKQKTSAING